MPPRHPEDYIFGSPEHVEAIKGYIIASSCAALNEEKLDEKIAAIFWSNRVDAPKDTSINDTLLIEDGAALQQALKLREYVSSMSLCDFNDSTNWPEIYQRLDPLLAHLIDAIRREIASTTAGRTQILAGSARTRARELLFDVADLWHAAGGTVGTNRKFVGFADLVTRPIRREHRDPSTIRFFAENSVRGAATEWRKLRAVKTLRGRPKKRTEDDCGP